MKYYKIESIDEFKKIDIVHDIIVILWFDLGIEVLILVIFY